MASKSKNPNIAIQNPQLRTWAAGQVSIPMVDSGSGIVAGSVCELTSGEIKLGTEQNTAALGITRNAIAIDAGGTVEWGFVPAKTASSLVAGDRIAPRASGRIGKAQAAQVSLLDATAGDAFTNQPANDGIEIVSDAAGDTTQSITLYGVKNAALTVLVTETVALNGTTAVSSTITDWYTLLGARLSADCAGTITIREASGNAAITTIAAASLTAGIHAGTSTQAYGLVPRRDGSGASTATVGCMGIGIDGTTKYTAAAMDGTTEGDLGTTPYSTVVEWYLGGLAANVNINSLTNEATDANAYCGVAIQAASGAGQVVDVFFQPYWMK
jgi:hypothetical protein